MRQSECVSNTLSVRNFSQSTCFYSISSAKEFDKKKGAGFRSLRSALTWATRPSVSLPFLIRYELPHKPLDSLGLAYPGAVTRLLKLFILLLSECYL
nr:MAG TPA: hypothetical protein [Caudoviricetes sp.]